MKQFIQRNKKSITGIIACLMIGGVTMSFQDTPYVNQIMDNRIAKDTVPDKTWDSQMKMEDFDDLMKSFDEDMIRVGIEMKELDMDLVRQQVEMSLKEIDIEKIMKDVEESLANIDMTKILADIDLSFKDEDWKEHEGEVKEALEEARQELEEAKKEFKNVDRLEIQKELAEAKKEMEEARKELKEIDMDKVMKEAKEEMSAAKEELKQMKAMFNEMEKEGLIDTKKGFSVEYKNKDLYINGLKQQQSVSEKYRKYIKGDHFKIKIEKE